MEQNSPVVQSTFFLFFNLSVFSSHHHTRLLVVCPVGVCCAHVATAQSTRGTVFDYTGTMFRCTFCGNHGFCAALTRVVRTAMLVSAQLAAQLAARLTSRLITARHCLPHSH
jgi:hypothetical protein